MPLPPSGYSWRWVAPDGSSWRHRGDQPVGYLVVPPEHASADSDTLTVDGGAVRAKNSSELRAEAARAKLAQINAHVSALIAQGFSYGGQTFSLSDQAQSNLHALKARAATLTWPISRANMDDTAIVTLANSTEGLAFYNAAMDALEGPPAAGRVRKAQVVTALGLADAAQGLADINAISVPW